MGGADDLDGFVQEDKEIGNGNGNKAQQVRVHFPSKKDGNNNGTGDRTSGEDEASGDLDLTAFVDRTPLTMSDNTPMEYAVECFGKLGLKHLMITEEGTGKLRGVCLKKRVIQYIESLHEDGH